MLTPLVIPTTAPDSTSVACVLAINVGSACLSAVIRLLVMIDVSCTVST